MLELIVVALGALIVVALAAVLAYRRGGKAEVSRRVKATAATRVCRIVEFTYDDGGTRVRHSICHGDVSVEHGNRLRGPGVTGTREIGAHDV